MDDQNKSQIRSQSQIETDPFSQGDELRILPMNPPSPSTALSNFSAQDAATEQDIPSFEGRPTSSSAIDKVHADRPPPISDASQQDMPNPAVRAYAAEPQNLNTPNSIVPLPTVQTPVSGPSWAPHTHFSQPRKPGPAYTNLLSPTKFIIIFASILGALIIATGSYLLVSSRTQTVKIVTTPSLSNQQSITGTTNLNLNVNTTVTGGRNLKATGEVLIQGENNSINAFRVQDSASNNVLIVDTTNQKVGINTTPTANGSDLQVAGDIAAGGRLNASGGNTNLSNNGLTINNVLVCTANGCNAAAGAKGVKGDAGSNGANGAAGTNGSNGVGCSSGSCVQLQNTSPGVPDVGNLNISGTAIAGAFQGDGSGLSNVDAITLGGNNSSFFTNADNLTSGTLNDGRLSPNVTLLGNSFNGANQLVQLNPSGDLPVLSGINLTNLDASNVAAGTLNDLRLSPNVTLQGNTFNGANQLLMATAADFLPALNGSLVTNLNASNVASGTLNDNRLSTNVALLNANQTFSGNGTFSNAIITPSLQSGGPTLNIGTASATLSLQGSLASSFGAVSGGNSVRIGFVGVPMGNILYQFDTATTPGTYTVCTTVGNCAGSGTGATTLGGSTNKVAKFTGANSIGNSSISDDGTSIIVQPNSNSTASFQVQNVAGTSNLFMADTTNTRIAIAKATASYTLDVGGTVSGVTILQNGNQVCDVSGNCTGTGGAIGGGGSIGTIPVFSASNTIANSLLAQSGSTVTTTGNFNVTGQYQVGNTQIASFNLADSANLAKLNGTGPQIFTGNNKFTGNTLFQNAANSTTAFQIQNLAGNSNLLIADTANNRIGIDALPTYTLDVGGDINISSGSVYRVNGVAVCGPTATCAPSTGSGNYIQNNVAQQNNANFNIRSVSSGSVVGILRGAVGQTADLLHLQDENGANVFTVDSIGDTLIRPASNSTDTFQVQNALGTSNLFIADTTNTRIGIGATPASSLLTIGTNTSTAAGGISFGTDTDLYRVAPGTLKVDGAFETSGAIALDLGGSGTKLTFGSAFDTNLYRLSPGILETDGGLVAAGNLQAQFGLASNVRLGNVGPSGAAGITLGSAVDTNLYRSSAGVLATDGSLNILGAVGNRLYVDNGGDPARLGNAGPSNQSGILLGVSGDTNLYRSSAGILRTDGALQVAGGNYVEASPAGNSRLIESGTGTATSCGNGSVCTGTISFTGYTSAPTVVATLKNADHGGYEYALSVSNITSTGATINVAISNAAFNFNGNVTVTWMAEGH